MLKIAIVGGTGLVGKALTKKLLKAGHELVILTRETKQKEQIKNVTYVKWLSESSQPEKMLSGVNAVINLAGESINNRWTTKMKQKIKQSRIHATEEIMRIIEQLEQKPDVYIQASAIGYYGTSETATFTESSEQIGTDFLAQVVSAWEQAGKRIAEFGIRTVYLRFGLILERDDGALPRIVLPYKLFAGGTLGSGNQWVSWIHIEDVCQLIAWILTNEQIDGVVNVTAPEPIRMNELGKAISNVLHRPHWFPVPAFLLKAVLGEMSLLILQGQRVLPEKLLQHGYQFRYKTIQPALHNILRE